jgi:hypothetical protein
MLSVGALDATLYVLGRQSYTKLLGAESAASDAEILVEELGKFRYSHPSYRLLKEVNYPLSAPIPSPPVPHRSDVPGV